MGQPLLLDLFAGAGGAAAGYNRAGFDVVGVDIKPQPRYPFEFVQAEALTTLRHLMGGGRIRVLPLDDAAPVYSLADFDAIHASPPCQRYTVGAAIHDSAGDHPDLVAECRRLLEATGRPWVIENVPNAPLRRPLVLCGLMFGLKVIRHRLFESSFLMMQPEHRRHLKDLSTGTLTAKRGGTGNGYSTGAHGLVCVAGNNFVREAGAAAMGIDWMTRKELAQAIPPAYTEFVGKNLLAALGEVD